MPKLVVDNLRVTYGPIVGTDGVTLALEAGETLALVGSNGAGKSSTLKAILGMAHYDVGRITLDGADLKGLKPSQVVRRGVGYSPEGRRVFPQLSVQDNLKVGAISRPAGELAERLARIFGYFPRLQERADQRAGSLSGGEQQMLALGRAMLRRPRLLMLDEPSLGLAPRVVESIFDAVRHLAETEGLSVLLLEQNVAQALRIVDRVYVMRSGRIILDETVEQMRARGTYWDLF